MIKIKNIFLCLIGLCILGQPIFAKCPTGTIIDEVYNQCYYFPFQCGDLYYLAHPVNGKCLAQCPSGYTQTKDNNNQNICQLSQCSLPDVFNFVNDFYCFKTPSEVYCNNYKVIDGDQRIVCLQDEPNGFVSSYSNGSFTSTSNDSNFKWSQKNDFLQCQTIRDTYELTCLTDKSQCKGYYTADDKTCRKRCRSDYKQSYDEVAKQNICVKTDLVFDANSCPNGFISINTYNNFNFVQCNQDFSQAQYLAIDSNNIGVNLPYCPNGFTEGVDVLKGIKTCTSPSNFSWVGNPILQCSYNMISYSDLKCLSKPSDCTEYIDINFKRCIRQCSDNQQPVSEKNGKKFCVEPLKVNFRQCIFPNIPYIAPYSKCLGKDEKNKCDQFLVKDSIENYMCLPYCPNGFTDTSTPTQKSCSSPSNFNWHNSQILKSYSSQTKNYASLKSDNGELPCETDYNVLEINSCFKDCPNNFTVITRQNSQYTYKQCISPDDNYERQVNDIGELSEFQNKFSDFPDSGEQAEQESDCTKYIIKDEQGYILCWPTCPVGYTQSINQTTGQKICTPANGILLKDLPFWKCEYPNVKDGTNLECLSSISECKTNMDYRNYACLPQCFLNSEPFYNEKLGINVCKYPKCYSPSAFNFLTLKCVPSYQDCSDQYLLSDEGEYKSCIPECPTLLTKSFDQTLNQNTCVFPKGSYYKDSELGQCKGPLIRDLTNGKCLQKVSDCQGYYIKSLNRIALKVTIPHLIHLRIKFVLLRIMLTVHLLRNMMQTLINAKILMTLLKQKRLGLFQGHQLLYQYYFIQQYIDQFVCRFLRIIYIYFILLIQIIKIKLQFQIIKNQ